MPLYEYLCDACGRTTELLQRMSEPPLAVCPHCGGTVKKQFSAPAFQFKGSGWSVTDYARLGGGAGAKAGEGGAEKPAGQPKGGDAAGGAPSEAGAASKSASKSDTKSEPASAPKGDGKSGSSS